MRRLNGRWLLWFWAFLIAAPALLIATPAAAAPGLWVVRDSDTEITLFGTIHALPKGTKVLGPLAQARFDAADSLVLETIIPDDKYALASLVNEMGTRPGLKPLLARVSKAAAPDLADAAARLNLPLANLDRLETWLAAIALSEASLGEIGVSAEDGVEPALMARAKAEGKPMVGLESVQQQLQYFNALPEADQVKMLEATVQDMKTAKLDTDKLIALWQAGDVEVIANDFAREAKASPLLTKVLLTNRNRRWADWIGGVMKRPGKVFMAVGAGHFGGPNGLLALLAARGMPAERILEPGSSVPAGLMAPVPVAEAAPDADAPANTVADSGKKPVKTASARGKKSVAKVSSKSSSKAVTKRKPAPKAKATTKKKARR